MIQLNKGIVPWQYFFSSFFIFHQMVMPFVQFWSTKLVLIFFFLVCFFVLIGNCVCLFVIIWIHYKCGWAVWLATSLSLSLSPLTFTLDVVIGHGWCQFGGITRTGRVGWLVGSHNCASLGVFVVFVTQTFVLCMQSQLWIKSISNWIICRWSSNDT